MLKEKKSNVTNNLMSAISQFTARLGDAIEQHIKGQTYAKYCVQESFFETFMMEKTSHCGPKLFALFVGSNGVGKTAMVEAFASQLSLPYRRFDMSGYSDNTEGVFKFRGIHGSFQSARTGEVTSYVRDNPNALLLFDELDRAHPNVLNLVNQILEHGELEDAYINERISFKNTIVIMTTNVGKKLFQDLNRYNYATLPVPKVLEALRTEKNPETKSPYFDNSLVSRLGKGKVIVFNRLNGKILCDIAQAKMDELFDRFHKKNPTVCLECDEYALVKTLLFSKGIQIDARILTSEVEHFFGTHVFEAVQKYSVNQQDFNKLSKIKCTFDFSDGNEDVKKVLEGNTEMKIAVFCAEEEREAFLKNPDLQFDFVSMEDRVNSLYYDCAIVSVDLAKNKNGMEYFRKLKKENDLPVHIFSLDEGMDSIDVKTYFCEGAESAYLKRDGEEFSAWLHEIVLNVKFARSFSDLGRANKVLQYDTVCSYENTEEGSTLLIKTFNYRLGRAIYANDEGKLVADHEIPNVYFKDVRGMDSTVAEMQKLIPYIKEFKMFARNGNRIPRGVLLTGRPGTGKTLLAKTVSREASVPIIQRNASEFLRHGDAAEAICEVFALARKYAPSILFIDEVDAIAKKRGRAFSMDMVESGLNALLSEMDGFAHDDMRPVFVIAATNFEIDDSENALDSAFVRRFDTRIHVELPNLKGRLDIFRYYLGKHSVSIPDNKLMNLAQRSQGRSPADIELIVEQAYSKAPDGKINMLILEEAFEKYVYGEKRQWDVEVMRKTSYHEAGHALVSYLTGNTPAYVTNISRGSSGGYMQMENNENKSDYTKQELLNQICISFAGRAAEQLIYGEAGITTGAASDIKRARQYAIMLVSDFAMENDFFLGIDSAQSEKAKEQFDETVRSILAKQYARAMDMLKNNREVLQKLSDALMRENSLNTEQILAIVEPKIGDVDKQEITDMRKEVVMS